MSQKYTTMEMRKHAAQLKLKAAARRREYQARKPSQFIQRPVGPITYTQVRKNSGEKKELI